MLKSSSLENTIKAIEMTLKEYSWLFIHINKNHGTLSLPKHIIDFVTKFEQRTWSIFYESQQKLNTIPFLCFFEPEEIEAFMSEVRELPSDDVDQLRTEIEAALIEELSNDESEDFDFEIPTRQEIEEYLKTTPIDQQQKDLLKAYFFCTAFLTQSFQFLSLVTHGRTMHELVTSAIEGDDIAFCHAVQIDRTVLFTIPYFRERLIRLQLGKEKTLLESLGRSIQIKPYGVRYKNPELWLVFSILHRAEYLKPMPLEDLLALCVRLNVYRGYSTKAIGKRRSEFLRRQRRPN